MVRAAAINWKKVLIQILISIVPAVQLSRGGDSFTFLYVYTSDVRVKV